MAAEPPHEYRILRKPDLVELDGMIENIRLDMRYATTNNFLGAKFYESDRALLQRPAAESLAAAADELRPLGFGFIIFDAYRPWYVTKMFWDATPGRYKAFIAKPTLGSRHNRGCAVDLTLYSLTTGEPLPMPSEYDDFSERAHPYYPGGTAEQRRNRDLLRRTMEKHGFRVYKREWWHFDYKDWRHYPIMNVPLEEIDEARGTNGGARMEEWRSPTH